MMCSRSAFSLLTATAEARIRWENISASRIASAVSKSGCGSFSTKTHEPEGNKKIRFLSQTDGRGPTRTKLTIHEEKTVRVPAPAGARFKGELHSAR
jgi:hypothetical protein